LEKIPRQHRAVVEAALAAYRDDDNDKALKTSDLSAFRRWSGEVLSLP
jgi:hypothetical protein